MQEKYIKSKIDLSAALLCYGLFCVLCHACAVLFFFFVNPRALPTPYLNRYCIGMLEYCVMSIAVLVGKVAHRLVGAHHRHQLHEGDRPWLCVVHTTEEA